MHVCGVSFHRPDFYPPAYEESLDVEKQACPAGFPPPLYTETSLELEDLEDESDPQVEAPPPYQEIMADAVAAAKAQHADQPRPVLKAGTALQLSALGSC